MPWEHSGLYVRSMYNHHTCHPLSVYSKLILQECWMWGEFAFEMLFAAKDIKPRFCLLVSPNKKMPERDSKGLYQTCWHCFRVQNCEIVKLSRFHCNCTFFNVWQAPQLTMKKGKFNIVEVFNSNFSRGIYQCFIVYVLHVFTEIFTLDPLFSDFL